MLAGTANLTRFGRGLPADHRARSSRRSRSTSSCSSCSARWRATPAPVAVRIGSENRRRGAAARPVVISTGYGTGSEVAGRPRASSARPGWTTRRRWRRCAPSRATSRGSWPTRGRTDVEPTRGLSVSDYYEVLGVAGTPPRRRSRGPTASWRASSTPTSTPSPEAEEQFKDVSQAYDVLSDPEKRRVVRPGRRPASAGGGGGFGQGFSFSDIMDAFFGGGARRRRARPAVAAAARPGRADPARHRPARGDVRRRARARRRHRGRSARPARGNGAQPGTGTRHLRGVQRARRGPAGAALVPRPGHDLAAVRRLPGLRHGHRRPVPRVLGRGPGARAPHAHPEGPGRRRHRHPDPARRPRARSAPAAARPATCTSRSRSRQHATFTRRGDDLHCTVELPMTAAALGTTLQPVDTLDGEESLDVRPGTQTGQTVTLRGQGRHAPARRPAAAT